MTALFTPITLRSLRIPNRIWMSPMCQYSAAIQGAHLGAPTDWHITHLSARAAGGVGLAMVEATAVRPDGRISPADLGLWTDQQQQAFARLIPFIEAHGAVPAIQLAHAGRKASTPPPWGGDRAKDIAWPAIAPSALAFNHLPTPTAIDENEIARVVEAFGDAAARAARAGFKVIEIHGAHGYLIHSFLSPYTNRRNDRYGGSFENRTRFALEVVDAVRSAWPQDLPVLFRISATDWLTENPNDPRDGWTSDDTVQLVPQLAARGVDLLDVSSGALVPDATIPIAPGYQVPLAAEIRTRTGFPVGAVGLITKPKQAADIVDEGQADAVLLGRELLRDPYWPHRAAQELGTIARWPMQYCYAV